MNSRSDTDPALRAHPTPDALWEALERALELMEDPRHLHGILSAYRAALAAAEAAPLDGPLMKAVMKFYADQMPAYAVAAGLDREGYAAVMVDVHKVRAALATTSRSDV